MISLWLRAALAFLKGLPWQLYAGVALLIAGFVIGVTQCAPEPQDPKHQIEAGTKAADAVGDAAKEVIEALDNQRVTEVAIDSAIGTIEKEIDNAKDADAVRAAVISGLCGTQAHRDDPACAMQQVDP